MTSDKTTRDEAEDLSNKSMSAARDALGNAREHSAQAADQASDLAGQASNAAGELYGRARDRVQGLSDRLPNSASDAYRAGRQAYSQGSERVIEQVGKQPIEALLLAGALGYLVGWATSRS